jgi:DNA-binding NarL/FixJ family response regulator
VTQSSTHGAAASDATCAPEARVLICSPIRIYADGIALGLAGVTGVRVVGASRDADGCVQQAERLAPDVVLLDLATGGAT